MVRLHQDSVSEFNEGDEVKDSMNDFGDIGAFVVSDAFARVPRGTVGFDHNLGRFRQSDWTGDIMALHVSPAAKSSAI